MLGPNRWMSLAFVGVLLASLSPAHANDPTPHVPTFDRNGPTHPADGVGPDPQDNGPNEPDNDACDTATELPNVMVGLRADRLGLNDPGDWFRVTLYRTESLSADTGGIGTLTFADTCDHVAITDAPVLVRQNMDYHLHVSNGVASYNLTWTPTQNDAGKPGDIGNTLADALPISAMPSYATPVPLKGALPARAGQLAPDEDWFRINTPLLEVPTTGQTNIALGLLTVNFTADCPGTFLFQLHQEDSVHTIGDLQAGCGQMTSSCITAGLSTVYAQTAAANFGEGTGYNLLATTDPLYYVTLDDHGLPAANVDPVHAWCDPIVPTLLSVLPVGNAIVDKNGGLVVMIPKATEHLLS